MDNVKLPAGTYVIVDPCYVLDESLYDGAFLNQLFDQDDNQSSNITLNGLKCAVFGTAYGDGTYKIIESHERYDELKDIDVDAGIIGAIPLSLCTRPSEEQMKQYNIFEFNNSFDCCYDNGKIVFGDIVVDTDPQYDDEDTCEDCGNLHEYCDCGGETCDTCYESLDYCQCCYECDRHQDDCQCDHD